ncbi:MAG: DNRLRE domain-containing protein, partial [Oscillochloris sp.]|nr:DNRLRE domain-containing protein [Oscillochloris sp.]
MYSRYRTPRAILAFLAFLVLSLVLTAFPALPAHAATLSDELEAVADARTQGGSPDVNFSSGALFVSTANGHLSFLRFDLRELPADAVIDEAQLQLTVIGANDGPNNVEIGRLEALWREEEITWSNQPTIGWGGPIQAVSGTGPVTWDVTEIVQRWANGDGPNFGFALRGDGGSGVSFASREMADPPILRLRVTIPTPEGGRSDSGDAPDSSNHHGVNNTAYAAGPVPGRFPTVWDVPAGQPAGPRHENATGEGFLGQYLSREAEADQGPDQDGPNNILRNAAGVIADVADNDRGDDGWRNRNITFPDCRQQTLTVRVSKVAGASLNRMYLNVWFDGNRDGDWADLGRCEDPAGGPAQAGYEWIVQDYVIDMSAVPAGGYLDFNIDTLRVINNAEDRAHWMRFTLSEERAVQPGGGAYPDGR